jgi:large subunit ribosomal protein L35
MCSRKRVVQSNAQPSFAEQSAHSSLEAPPGVLPGLTLDRAPPYPAVRPEAGKANQESQMPKLKTKSGAKKRFKITATGKVLFAQSGKRHGMIKRTNKQIRDHRGTAVLFKTDGDRIKQYWLPNG